MIFCSILDIVDICSGTTIVIPKKKIVRTSRDVMWLILRKFMPDFFFNNHEKIWWLSAEINGDLV